MHFYYCCVLSCVRNMFSPPRQLLAPHVRVWDSVSLNTLHVLGTGFFDRALVCLAFSKSVRKCAKMFCFFIPATFFARYIPICHLTILDASRFSERWEHTVRCR